MGITHSRIETISSANRTNGTNTDFSYTITPWSTEDSYDSVCLLYANIPITYYLISSGQNTFQLQEGATAVTIPVPVGNYSTTSFLKVLTTQLNTYSPNKWTYSITFPNSVTTAQTGLFTYTVSGNSSQPYFIFTTNIYSQMGFNNNTTYQFSGSSLTSVNIVEFVPETTLYLYSDMIQTKDNNTENILQEFFSSNTAPYTNIVYQCTAPELYSKKLNKSLTNYFHFTLLNENYQNINLNGQPFFFTIVFYRRDNILDLIKHYIRAKIQVS